METPPAKTPSYKAPIAHGDATFTVVETQRALIGDIREVLKKAEEDNWSAYMPSFFQDESHRDMMKKLIRELQSTTDTLEAEKVKEFSKQGVPFAIVALFLLVFLLRNAADAKEDEGRRKKAQEALNTTIATLQKTIQDLEKQLQTTTDEKAAVAEAHQTLKEAVLGVQDKIREVDLKRAYEYQVVGLMRTLRP